MLNTIIDIGWILIFDSLNDIGRIISVLLAILHIDAIEANKWDFILCQCFFFYYSLPDYFCLKLFLQSLIRNMSTRMTIYKFILLLNF